MNVIVAPAPRLRTEETTNLVNAAVLSAVKPGAILITTARVTVVDEDALVAALRSGEIAGAGLGVSENEPALAPGLSDLKNTMLLPISVPPLSQYAQKWLA